MICNRCNGTGRVYFSSLGLDEQRCVCQPETRRVTVGQALAVSVVLHH